MLADPREYRQNAWRCVELANAAKSPELKQTLLNLSKTWAKLAIEVERNHALTDEDPPVIERPA
jgi:hypothetical protein